MEPILTPGVPAAGVDRRTNRSFASLSSSSLPLYTDRRNRANYEVQAQKECTKPNVPSHKAQCPLLARTSSRFAIS